MKLILKIAFLSLLLLFFTCDEVSTTNSSKGSSTDSPTDTTAHNLEDYNEDGNKIESKDLKDCETSGKVLEKNTFRMDDIAQMICISADESTQDPELGQSHRVFEVFNTMDCSNLLKLTLPVNRSADFPYYLVSGCYEKINKIVGIQGYFNFYFYDAETQKLSKSLEPEFLTEREMVDAQSGKVDALAVWEKYILGYAIDAGAFSFDITDKTSPKHVLPIAEFNVPNSSTYHSLFMLGSENESFQAVIPKVDPDDGSFKIQTLFPQALKVGTSISKSAQNNRYIVLKDLSDPSQEKRIAIDMLSQKNIPLPDDIAIQKTSEILGWLKSQQ